MDIELLRTFLEVERLRHFRKASEELFVTQAAVSSRIKLLEETLGVPLFIRQKRQIDLTPEGHRFKRYAERLIAEWRKARHDVSLGQTASQLAVGGTIRVWDAGMQEWVHDVHRTYPELALILEYHTPETLIRKLLDGQLDLGFILEPPQIDIINIVQVAELELVMASTRPDVTVEEAMADGYISVDWGLSAALQHRRLYPDAPEPAIRIANASVALDFILEFGGAAYFSWREIADEIKGGEVFLVRDAAPIPRSVYAIHPVRTDRLDLISDVISEFKYRVALPKRPRRKKQDN
ncbi:LysR family transcriptional regulator [Granulosicoccus sp. 3-233]|uniref:LysR family transcriptional regulator n=1 Tax=Granulosicoccus sp. 3-233 TaxID=3417969 RepID=UPI003D338439